MVRFPGRPKFSEEGSQVRFCLAERDISLPGLPPSEGIEDEERLVRGALVALLPDAQVVEAG